MLARAAKRAANAHPRGSFAGVQELAAEESEAERLESEARQILADLAVAEETVEKLGSELDALFAAVLGETSLEGTGLDGDAPGPAFAGITEAMFTSLARDRAPDAEALLRLSEERVGPAQWRTFQVRPPPRPPCTRPPGSRSSISFSTTLFHRRHRRRTSSSGKPGRSRRWRRSAAAWPTSGAMPGRGRQR